MIQAVRNFGRDLTLLTMLLLPGLAAAANQAPVNSPRGVAIISPSGITTLKLAQIQALPAITVKAAFGTEHGPFKAVFSGPLLWAVLTRATAIDPKQPKSALRGYILVTGSDGYSALLALGEIAPFFENKHVILATEMNGKSLGAQHLRLVVPGDAKGGRSVRDVVRIEVATASAPPPK